MKTGDHIAWQGRVGTITRIHHCPTERFPQRTQVTVSFTNETNDLWVYDPKTPPFTALSLPTLRRTNPLTETE